VKRKVLVRPGRPKVDTSDTLKQPEEGGTKKVATTIPIDEHLVSFLMSHGYSRPRAEQMVSVDPDAVKKMIREQNEQLKPAED
jgi:hypothetical protein